MSEAFLALATEDRTEALSLAASESGRPAHLLEKDVMVVWALGVLASSPFDAHLVFKGGTSLSKAYGVIDRFSEDIDLTYDIREIAPDLIAKTKSGWPENNSQQKAWTKEIRARLDSWIADHVAPVFDAAIAADTLDAKVELPGNGSLIIAYGALTAGTGYVLPRVLLEFGARATGEPAERRSIGCDAAPYLADLAFPAATPRVMLATRTFWEKATAIHVFCRQGRFRGGDRFARHWYDIVRLDEAGITGEALADRALAQDVAHHKQLFFVEKDETGAVIDYSAAVNGALALVPEGEARAALAEDYANMLADGLILGDAPDFDALMARCDEIVLRANTAAQAAAGAL